MLRPYSKTISLSLCMFSISGLAGCQYVQQKVYQQASRPSPEYQEQMETMPPRYQSRGNYQLEPAPAPLEDNFPPAAPPSLIPPGSEQTSNQKRFSIRKVSDEESIDDSEYFKSMFDDEPEEPAQKYLGLVPHYSTVSSSMSNKVNQINGKVKGFYSRMKSHVKTPDWVRKVSGSHVEVIEEESFCGDLSCINSEPVFEATEMPEEVLQPEPVKRTPALPAPPQKLQPQPDVKTQQLPQLPPPGEATNFNNSWRVSAIREPLSVEEFSTPEDQLEIWPYAKPAQQQQQVRKFEFKPATPISAPDIISEQPEFNHPRELTVPSMISQDQSVPLRKISHERFQIEKQPVTNKVEQDTPILITPRKVY
ncbi:hypothetical protein [Gimesia algae]|uniref:Uncharacterized protein n=1 Tax=Gimesia algae TaxID=2527971 RepID=A0A517VH29_9PLAN|nr:hypothetical protein [Gimesia algae]QDT92310.1 hypothetical protein Pan161_39770 [Gimesia algae]